MENQNLTGYPSIDKPLLKYYSEEVINATFPEETIYEIIRKNNQDNLTRTAIDYYGKKLPTTIYLSILTQWPALLWAWALSMEISYPYVC